MSGILLRQRELILFPKAGGIIYSEEKFWGERSVLRHIAAAADLLTCENPDDCPRAKRKHEKGQGLLFNYFAYQLSHTPLDNEFRVRVDWSSSR